MDFLNTPLNVNHILDNSDSSTNNTEIEFHIYTTSMYMKIEYPISLEILSDFNSNFTDIVIANFLMPLGDYVKILYPNRDSLNITIIKKIGKLEYVKNMKLIVLNSDQDIDSGRLKKLTREELNKESLVNIECQCINYKAELMRRLTTSGSYLQTTVKDVILSSYKEVMASTDINGTSMDLKINIKDPDNKDKYNQILIPKGTRIIDLAAYLQETDYGVYNGGIGTFISEYRKKKEEFYQNEVLEDMMFIYPLYTTSNFDTSVKKLKIYSLPTKLTDFFDKRHLDSGDLVEIIVSDNVKLKNVSPNALINDGNGFTSIKTSSVLSRNISIEEDTIKTSKTDAMNDKAMKKRRDNLNFNSYTEPSNNLYTAFSKLYKNSGQVLQIEWTYSVPEIIFPGMPIRFYLTNELNEVEYLDGTVQGIFTKIDNDKKISVSVLNIFLETKSIEE